MARPISSAGPMTPQGVPNPVSNSFSNRLKSWMCLRLLVGEPQQRAHLVIIAVHAAFGVLDHRRQDVLLDQAEEIQVA